MVSCIPTLKHSLLCCECTETGEGASEILAVCLGGSPVLCCSLNLKVKTLGLYLAFSRSGPNKAPRAHMGSPVWAASNHFTATSPETSRRGKRKKEISTFILDKKEKRKTRSRSIGKLCRDQLSWESPIAKHFPFCCISSIPQFGCDHWYVVKQEICNDSWKGKRGRDTIKFWEFHCSVSSQTRVSRCALQLVLSAMQTIILPNS